MKKLIGLALFILAAAGGCGGGGDSFSDSLALGTGMNPSNFTLTGETDTFTGTPQIYFRLESAKDMNGSSVQIEIEQQLLGGANVVDTLTYQNPQSYGHILMSSFPHNYGQGNFRVTGTLVTGNHTVATAEYSVQ
jgi:hypothetical protein